MKYGFLFGAGAEIAYNLPSGGCFALEIFRQNISELKQEFKNMRDNVDSSTAYASQWLPQDYLKKNISTFGKTVFQNIIMSTVEHRRDQIIKKINDFDKISVEVITKMKADGLDVDNAFEELLDRDVLNIRFSQNIAYNENFIEGNKLFESNYFSALLTVYRDREDVYKQSLRRILLSIMQLQLGALSEKLSQNINDNLFSKKDERIDIFDDFGELITLNYSLAGVSGLEYLLENQKVATDTSYGIILCFAQSLIENIYSSVLDYKALIDSNWHYLYSPSSDWAKFCKVAIFLLGVHRYITNLGDDADKSNEKGYYNMLRKCLDESKYQVSAIATTNYNKIIEEILGNDYPVIYLNGSVSVWYDPYLNKVGTKSELDSSEHHIIVPLLFTQSGTKPMTSISMAEKYVKMYYEWRDSDAIVVVGFGFGNDDEHINGILRTLVNDDGKELVIVTLNHDKKPDVEAREVAKNLKITDYKKIKMLLVDYEGKIGDKTWTECLNSPETLKL